MHIFEDFEVDCINLWTNSHHDIDTESWLIYTQAMEKHMWYIYMQVDSNIFQILSWRIQVLLDKAYFLYKLGCKIYQES